MLPRRVWEETVTFGQFSKKFFFASIRSSKTTQNFLQMATYEEVKNMANEPDKYLIDVRNREEVTDTGAIPASINIPLPELETALQANDEDFQKKYERPKPANDAIIIFTCVSGKRASEATELAQKMQFTNAKTYIGSWQEWANKQAEQ